MLSVYLGVVTGIQFFSHRYDVVFEELEPLFLEADLVHVNVNGGHVLIASG